MKQRVKVSKNGVAFLFTLPCVEYITKIGNNGLLVGARTDKGFFPAFDGDWLCENDNGEWSIERQ